MAHGEQMWFFRRARHLHPEFFFNSRVLEVGSRNVNGSVREFFTNCDYVGLDCTPGADVDVVTLAHEYVPDSLFDTVVSGETFEHDPHYRVTIPYVLGLLRPGGLFVATWASPKRQEHGTRSANNPEGIFGPDPDYYRGLSVEEFKELAEPYLDLEVCRTERSELDCVALGFRIASKPSQSSSR